MRGQERERLGVVGAVFLVYPAVEFEGGDVDDAAAFAGGGGFVDALEIGADDAGVNLRGEEGGVAEHFLDVAHLGSAFEHFGGTGVAEAVDGDAAGEPGGVAVADEVFADVVTAASAPATGGRVLVSRRPRVS